MEPTELRSKSVADLPGFPFATFDEFRQAVAQGQARVWVRYDFRTDWALKDGVGIGCVGLPFLVSVTLGVWAVCAHDFWLLLGIPAAMVGFGLATPGPDCASGCVPMMVTLAGFAAMPLVGMSLLWIALAVDVSWFAVCFGVRMANMAVRAAMVESEENFLWLYSRRVITLVQKTPQPVEPDVSVWPPPPTNSEVS